MRIALIVSAGIASLAVSAAAQVVGPRGPNNPQAQHSGGSAGDPPTITVQRPADAPTITATPRAIEAPVTAVTAYQGRAAVTRSGSLDLPQGLHAVRFSDLPASIDAQTLQAKVGDAARLVNVEYQETPVPDPSGSPAMMALDKQLEAAQLALKSLEEDRAMLAAQTKLIEQIGVRAAADATRDGGTAQLDLDALRRQLAFVQAERARLVTEDRAFAEKIKGQQREVAALEARRTAMGQVERVARSAEITIAVPDGGTVPISLTYLVSNAGWEPIYAVRGAADRSGVTIEFDANLAQRSGEDWKDVALTISTAQPTVRANPPTLAPIFVAVVPPPPAPEPTAGAPGGRRGAVMGRVGSGGGGGGFGAVDAAGAPMEGGLDGDSDGIPESEEQKLRVQLGESLRSLSSEAAVVEGGTAVSYELPRRVTVPTNADRVTRTRVATITPTASFLYTAVPLLTDAVYLRGKLVNASQFQLVPGKAQVFMGPEYVGPTSIGSVAPNGEFTVYFGIDRAIRATRTLVSKNTSESGVFSKSVETVRNYRVLIDNGSGRPIDLELLDRRPVSRDEKIVVTLDGLSAPLSTNPEYLRDGQPQGILRWDLSVPAGASGPSALPVTWTTKLSAPKDLLITIVPD